MQNLHLTTREIHKSNFVHCPCLLQMSLITDSKITCIVKSV